MKIIIGSRDSRLAVVQAEAVMQAIRDMQSNTTVSLLTMKTTGDKILDRTLDKIGGKGLFVKELDRALQDKQVDFTVHSMKDLPMEIPQQLPIVAVSAREDVRDALILREGMAALPDKPRLGCASARRRIQLARLFPAASIEPIRGNVQTRLRKLDEGQFDALVLAAAGLKRLGLDTRISRYFSADEILPAAGQGIIAVQGRMGADASCLATYHNADSLACVTAERAFVRALEGGCSSPVAAYAQLMDGNLHLRGMYVSEDESIVRFGNTAGSAADAQQLGCTLAKQLQEDQAI